MSIRSSAKWRHVPSITPVAIGQPLVSAVGVVEVGALGEQVVGAAVSAGSLVGVETQSRGLAADRGGDGTGLSVEHGAGFVAHPTLGGGIALVEEAPRRPPQIFQYVHAIDEDRDVHLAVAGLLDNPVNLMVVAVDERDPIALVGGVAALRLLEHPCDRRRGIVADGC